MNLRCFLDFLERFDEQEVNKSQQKWTKSEPNVNFSTSNVSGSLLGIKGHRMQGSLKVKRHVRKSQSQSSSCRAVDSFSERNHELFEYAS